MRILHIDDSEPILILAARMLATQGFEVTSLISAEETNASDWGTYDLMILDWMLPGITGIELARRARAEGYKGPILILSSRELTRSDRLEIDEAGAAHMSKPFGPNQLLNRVQSLLSEST